MGGCNVNIPFYGKGKYLRDVVRSVQQQIISPDRIELTVIDDQSPEPAEASLPSSLSVRCRVVRNPHNLGLAGNWNRCLEHGEREYIHVLHSDDLLHPLFYTVVLPVLDLQERVGLVYTGVRVLFTRMTSTRYWGSLLRKQPVRKQEVRIYRAGDEAMRQVWQGVVPCSSVVLRRRAVEKVGRFRADLPYSPDEEYWMRVAKHWDVAHIPAPLTVYRYHSGNYQLKTWLYPDFWEKFKQTRLGRLCHLDTPMPQDYHTEAHRLAQSAVGIAHKLLAAGQPDFARKYLGHAVEVFESIREEPRFRQIAQWLEQGARGRFLAWLRNSH